ncbi:MAG: hypothetical protein LRZ88_11035 [Candidatus Cloacimonetes bacterium]|nr:hypothetical protein [Candidatus Cloacimonadota bacterium]
MERYPNINILLNLPRDYIPKAEFVFRTYCYILRLNPKFIYGSHFEAAHLYYGPPGERDHPLHIHYDPEAVDFFGRQDLYPLEQVNFCRFGADSVPFLFSKGGAIFSYAQDSCILRKDIVASGFYFLTCWHEYVFSERGLPKGRVDYKESLQFRWDFTEVPVVDIYCRILLYAMKDYLPEFIRDISWRDDRRFAVSLSHDIDYWDFWDEDTLKNTFLYNKRSFTQRPLKCCLQDPRALLAQASPQRAQRCDRKRCAVSWSWASVPPGSFWRARISRTDAKTISTMSLRAHSLQGFLLSRTWACTVHQIRPSTFPF